MPHGDDLNVHECTYEGGSTVNDRLDSDRYNDQCSSLRESPSQQTSPQRPQEIEPIQPLQSARKSTAHMPALSFDQIFQLSRLFATTFDYRATGAASNSDPRCGMFTKIRTRSDRRFLCID